MTNEEQFGLLQADWREKHAAWQMLRDDLNAQYGGLLYKAPKTKTERMNRLFAKAEQAAEAIFQWLKIHSPRQWNSIVPLHWVCSELSYEDAITTGQLSVIPPPAYGYALADVKRFAQPVQPKE